MFKNIRRQLEDAIAIGEIAVETFVAVQKERAAINRRAQELLDTVESERSYVQDQVFASHAAALRDKRVNN